jgi:hypothetical protein
MNNPSIRLCETYNSDFINETHIIMTNPSMILLKKLHYAVLIELSEYWIH